MTDAVARDAEVWAERERLAAKCATLLHDLLQQLRTDLGLSPADAARQVFFCTPEEGNPGPDEPIDALATGLLAHRIRLDVEIEAPNARPRLPPRIRYVILEISERNETQCRITFDGGKDQHEIIVDPADSRTFAKFSAKLIGALLDYFNTDVVGKDSHYVRSPIGSPPHPDAEWRRGRTRLPSAALRGRARSRDLVERSVSSEHTASARVKSSPESYAVSSAAVSQAMKRGSGIRTRQTVHGPRAEAVRAP